MSQHKTNDDDLDFDLEILKVTRRNSGAGTWVVGERRFSGVAPFMIRAHLV